MKTLNYNSLSKKQKEHLESLTKPEQAAYVKQLFASPTKNLTFIHSEVEK